MPYTCMTIVMELSENDLSQTLSKGEGFNSPLKTLQKLNILLHPLLKAEKITFIACFS
jgi:hypothetical protein